MTENINQQPTVLIVEPNNDLYNLMSQNLQQHGFKIERAVNGRDALDSFKKDHLKPNLLIIESNLPDLSGVALSTIFRTKPDTKTTPIVMLTEKTKNMETIKGLDTGIDDYIIKPFTLNEFIASIKSLFRKTRTVTNNKVIEYKDIKMDTSSFRVSRGGREIHLGPTEFRILQCLMEYPKRILSRDHIIKHVWGYGSNVDPRTIDVHINRLRAALKNNKDDVTFIKTIRSAGYCLGGPGKES
jgi:two-component system phosphate regulon response regulator PhoB